MRCCPPAGSLATPPAGHAEQLAIDASTGKELWQALLPAGGQAIPMTYWSAKSGRQFVVIAAGGSLCMQSKIGDAMVAYALPKK